MIAVCGWFVIFVYLLFWVWLLSFNSVVNFADCLICLVLFGACCFACCLTCSGFTCCELVDVWCFWVLVFIVVLLKLLRFISLLRCCLGARSGLCWWLCAIWCDLPSGMFDASDF